MTARPAAPVGPEKPRHIDERITRLSTTDLIDAFGRPAGIRDLSALRRWCGSRLRRPAWPLPEWAEATRATTAAAEIIAEAQPLLNGVDVTGSAEGRSRRYGFHYLSWLRAGVSAWLITDDRRYLDAFEEHLLAWEARRDDLVGEWPGLDLIWYSLGTWSRCRQLLPTLEVLTDSSLSDRAWATLLATLIGGARWAYDEHDTFRHGNWQLASAAELIHIAAVLPDLTEAPDWGERGRARLREHLLLDVYPDGGHYERSPGYHSMCLDAVHTALNIDQRYGTGEVAGEGRVTAMHSWLIALADQAGWVPHLQDSGLVWPGRQLLRGGYLLDDPTLVDRARSWLSPEDFDCQVRQLPAWQQPARQDRWLAAKIGPGQPPAPRPTTRLLPHSGYAVTQSDDASGAVQLLINFGPYVEHELESHSHRPALDFVLSGWGAPLLWDAGGPPSYDDPDYLDWYQSGRGHNTVLVDDRECAIDRRAGCDLFEEAPTLPGRDTGRATVFDGHHTGYQFEQRRTLLLVRDQPSYLMVLDDAPVTDPHVYEFRLQSLGAWQRVGGGLSFCSTVDDAAATLRVIELEPVETEVTMSTGTARKPLPASQSAEYAPLHTLALRRRSGRFRTVVWPQPATSVPPIVGTDRDMIIVEHAGYVDRIRARQWSRTDGDDWEAFGWNTRQLVDENGPMFTSSCPVQVAASSSAERSTVVVDAPARCQVHLTGRWSDLRLNDIQIPTGSHCQDLDAGVNLPYGGRWTITGRRHG